MKRLNIYLQLVIIFLATSLTFTVNASEFEAVTQRIESNQATLEEFADVFFRTKFYTQIKKGQSLASIKSGNHTSESFEGAQQSDVIISEVEELIDEEMDEEEYELHVTTGKEIITNMGDGVGLVIVTPDLESRYPEKFVAMLKAL